MAVADPGLQPKNTYIYITGNTDYALPDFRKTYLAATNLLLTPKTPNPVALNDG